ncbi:hypothetical protein SAMD00019534_109140 [Acytostelium subglobosum LB1]|uniref:hypothetical protein n=1 Tax=Acytostelium subglobosum LB1 TaxID=1410327 RepID=UPI00064511F5|nr:hypothetical protein SAMD00019534_109140 [Acytostelium subglobosum LB1]GAM27738.1 hypothetical protein SAMD00019534_109140 [Acytostelium subglobosum LB1]|eukprot:XP_012749397.1 hypothetical protein SAMD00019534_109140 [Acytostelium subglobosum LB1]
MKQMEYKVEQWRQEHTDVLRRNQISHISTIHKMNENIERLNTEDQFLKQNDLHSKQIIKRQQDELQHHLDGIQELRSKEESLPPAVDSLGQMVHEQQVDLANTQRTVTTVERSNDERLSNVERTLGYFRTHLGLDIRISPDGAQFQFTKIDRKQPDRIFSVTVDFEHDEYRVVECTPMIGELKQLVESLNETNHLAGFIKSIRKQFVNISQQQQ